jgi:hypothetical protein
VRGQLHAPAGLLPKKEPPITSRQYADWAPGPIWTLWGRQKGNPSIAPARYWNPLVHQVAQSLFWLSYPGSSSRCTIKWLSFSRVFTHSMITHHSGPLHPIATWIPYNDCATCVPHPPTRLTVCAQWSGCLSCLRSDIPSTRTHHVTRTWFSDLDCNMVYLITCRQWLYLQ